MRFGYAFAGFVVAALIFFAHPASAQDPFEWEGDIPPEDIAGFPLIPTGDTETMDITIDSDIPLTIFIVDADELYYELIALSEGEIENFTGYAQKYEDVTYKEINQDYDRDKSYWVIMYNPSETDTASVTVEYEFWEDFTGEIIEEATSDVCCLLTMGAGLAGVIILAVLVMFARKRNL
ncbi:MAG: hypothetical protein ACMUHY_09135 [Thermoplasmatota archaeon]